jgi:galactose dehydrogenase
MYDLPTFPDLKGQSVFITGGGSGIGAAITEAFLRQGAKVAFCQRSDASAFCSVLLWPRRPRRIGQLLCW